MKLLVFALLSFISMRVSSSDPVRKPNEFTSPLAPALKPDPYESRRTNSPIPKPHVVRRSAALYRPPPPQLFRPPIQGPVYVQRLVQRPFPSRAYAGRPGMRIPYLPFVRVIGAPIPQPDVSVASKETTFSTTALTKAAKGNEEDGSAGIEKAAAKESPAVAEEANNEKETTKSNAEKTKSKAKKLNVKSGLENSSESLVEVLPVSLVVDMDVLATGILDLVNTLDESGLLPDDEKAREFKTALKTAKEGEHQTFEIDPKSMNVIFSEILKSQINSLAE